MYSEVAEPSAHTERQKALKELLDAEENHQKLVSALQASETALMKLRGRVAAMLQDVGFSPASIAVVAAEPTGKVTKSSAMKALFVKNSRLKMETAASEIENDTSAAAVKRMYAIRDYLVSTNQLERGENGEWLVIK